MRKAKPIYPALLSGQNDSRVEEGTELPRWTKVRNSRMRDGSLSCRAGMRRIAVCGTDAQSLDLTAASSHHVQIPAPAHFALSWPFTIETLLEPDVYSGTQSVVGFAHATDWPFRVWMSGYDLKITLTDSAGSTEVVTLYSTLGLTSDVYALQVAVDSDGGYTSRIQIRHAAGDFTASEVAGTLSIGSTLKAPGGDMYFGRENAGNYFDGHLDYFRVYRYCASNFDMAWKRWPSPRQTYMVADYGGEVDANDWVKDRSPYENHGEAKNTPGQATALAVNPAPVQALRSFRDKDHRTRLLVIAGGRVHSAEL